MKNYPSLPSDRIFTDAISRYTSATDASFYRYIPEVVIKPVTADEVSSLMIWARNHSKHLTFRAAGTSLSGQAQTDGYLVDIANSFKKIEIIENGLKVKAEPGITGSKVNEKLQVYGRKFGPDPASINACMVGGIIANNSSGMSSGIERNPYNTIESLRFILCDGMQYDTRNKTDYDKFLNFSGRISEDLLRIKSEIKSNQKLTNKIIDKYKLKNTIGYSLNSFLDFDHPLDILAHLMVGSEGTLGFIADSVFRTFPSYQNKLTCLLTYENIDSACKSLLGIRELKPEALEIMDYNSLKSVEKISKGLIELLELPGTSTALLVEFQEPNQEKLDELKNKLSEIIQKSKPVTEPLISQNIQLQTHLWGIRKGLLASLGGTKGSGTGFIMEDLCFPVDRMGEAINELQLLLKKFGYFKTGIFGHGLDGNIHFMITPKFINNDEINRFDRFNIELSDMVIGKYNGSMKAEHGTGRIMAPFIEKEWGTEAFNLMKRIKRLVDPDNTLNPDVLISSNPKIHLQNIKVNPVIEQIADNCIECGFCEQRCPSRELTLTPRKRIVLRREIERLKIDKSPELNELLNGNKYNSLDTCAVDGLCSLACPLGINTGELVKQFRRGFHSGTANYLAMFLSSNFRYYHGAIRFALRTAYFIKETFGNNFLVWLTDNMQKLVRTTLPKWNKHIGKAPEIRQINTSEPDFIYFPCCITRMMGKPSQNNLPSLMDVMISLSERAGIKLSIPGNISDYCCGTVFSSKGYTDAFINIINKSIEAMWNWSDSGKLPVIFDSTSCSHTIRTSENYLTPESRKKWEQMTFLDSIEFAHDYLLNRLELRQNKNSIILHPNCSCTKLGLTDKLRAIAENCSAVVIIPESYGCCGFAGDRGLLFPELNKSATKAEAREVQNYESDGYYSSNLPCETGMSIATGKQYYSFLYLMYNSSNEKK